MCPWHIPFLVHCRRLLLTQCGSRLMWLALIHNELWHKWLASPCAFRTSFFLFIFIIIIIIIIIFCDKLVYLYVFGWLLYQRIFNTFRSLPYPCSKLSHTLYYFHIIFPYFKLYGHILFVLQLPGTWVE